jgi:signal transduction histidine kinase
VKPLRYAIFLGVGYGVITVLYIWLSGEIAAKVAVNVSDLERIEHIKGFVFVATTALALFFASWYMFGRLWRATIEGEQLRQATLLAQSRVVAGEMAAAVAHDFNNNLMVIRCALTEARAATTPEESASFLAEAAQAVEKGSALALRLARTARGQRQQVQSQNVDLVPITLGMLRVLRKLPRIFGRVIETDVCDHALAEVDLVLYEQVVANLLLNAADACGESGRIRLVLSVASGNVRLEVHDDGPGVPPERRESIFSAFESSKPEGLGLGLLSVRAAVQAQAGKLTVTDSPLGGAAFIVELSCAEPVRATGTEGA